MTTELEKSEINSSVSIAHVRLDEQGEWHIHPLVDHLQDVAAMAGGFAQSFGAEDWAFLVGLWHDLGKYRPAFQGYIRKKSGYDTEAHIEGGKGRVDHSTTGASHACEQLGPQGRILAYLIAGHHAGLPDWNGPHSSLFQRLDQAQAKDWLREVLSHNPPGAILYATRPKSRPPGGALHCWIRLLFSCLVDADFLDTEAFMEPAKTKQRGMEETGVSVMLERFDAHMAEKTALAEDTPVNRIRSEVLAQCRAKAQEQPGLFSLTVPTGGGKTLSSLAFALEHAKQHNKRRIIYAIPYTSIIEQTAEIFRGIFGESVIEHHSNLDPDQETAKSRLATENWDAPLIVTTNVQLFESLFAARTSQCRKLHNLVNSVVVLDEAQLLPTEFLEPILSVIRDLSTHYGVSFVLSTATQPAFKPRQGFGWKFDGLDKVREIIDEPAALYCNLHRVEVILPNDFKAPEDWPAVAEKISQHRQVLVIVNRRGDARELAKLLPQAVHLSANLCGEHRSSLIHDIKLRLKEDSELCVVSTQLIEAGVDVDFPVVFRAFAGLDSIAQAAGRCNREGKLPTGLGQVFIFNPPKCSPVGLLRKGEATAKELLDDGTMAVLTPDLFERYFTLYYSKVNSLDKQGILDLLTRDQSTCRIQFRTAAEKFKLIDDLAQQSVIVRYGESEKWLVMLKRQGPERWLMRKLQRYTVSIPKSLFQKLLATDEVAEIYPGIYAQNVDGLYDKRRFGFIGGEGTNPLDLIF
ncbi:MAG: CRISPR-associated helicase/endonuclease Cas3 [Candidatus Methylumidiphilus alinenensis]|uniref:CRISPR-associated helicase/endonuclease Cas3 n=1 Tax=Candidatus Methylumidiphilus alinenensis TaxID=2202197 RepID=A0A2W4RJ54_9GAMM|nr:MAG: CRISPR-associated helicase/endonuclease Cas3 [Candidatus Methylumidiphilus alinenensis]